MTGIFLIFGFLAIAVWGTILGRNQQLSEYTSNRNRGSVWEVYCTTLSSLVGGWMFFGLNAMGYEAGLVGVAVGCGYAIGMGLLIWLAPRIKTAMSKGGFDTLDDFIGHHFGTKAQGLMALTNFAIFLSVLAAQFLAMTSYLKVIAPEFAGWLPLTAAFAVVIYTSIGGYKGVAVTDILKMILLVLGVGAFAGIVLSRTSSSDWASLPASYWTPTGYGIVFLVGAALFFPLTIIVRSDLWQRIVHAESVPTARKALGFTLPSLLVFYVVLTLIGMASRARLGVDVPKESAGLLLLHQDILAMPLPHWLSSFLVAIISLGIFGALASTADNNLNIAGIGLSKILFRTEWAKVAPGKLDTSATEKALLRKSRWLCLLVGIGSIGAALVMQDIVSVMVNVAWIMLLFLPATIGALVFQHRNSSGGFWSIIAGLIGYFGVLSVGVPLKSAFLPGLVVATLVYCIFNIRGKRIKMSESNPD